MVARLPPNFKDLTGHRIGRWIVKSYAGSNGGRGALWNCACDCGTKKIVTAGDILRGHSQSCGCLANELRTIRSRGARGTVEYRTWSAIKSRCHSLTNKDYKKYGGRGIVVCERWRKSFEAFLSDMGEKPSPNLSIDRINNDGNYEPGNCRWATATQQANNKRNNKQLNPWGRRHA